MDLPEEKERLLHDGHGDTENQVPETATKSRKYCGFSRREILLTTLIISLILIKIFLFKILFLDHKNESRWTVGHGHDAQGSLMNPEGSINVTERHMGQLTYYTPGLGSCGLWNTKNDLICAISHELYDSRGTPNPNNNPFCRRRIRASRHKDGKGWVSVEVTVVDRCEGCKHWDLDFSLKAFEALADLKQGRVDVQWEFID